MQHKATYKSPVFVETRHCKISLATLARTHYHIFTLSDVDFRVFAQSVCVSALHRCRQALLGHPKSCEYYLTHHRLPQLQDGGASRSSSTSSGSGAAQRQRQPCQH